MFRSVLSLSLVLAVSFPIAAQGRSYGRSMVIDGPRHRRDQPLPGVAGRGADPGQRRIGDGRRHRCQCRARRHRPHE